MKYHAIIQMLDAAANGFHAAKMFREKTETLRLAGVFQQRLLSESPYPKNTRFLNEQWVWALGHIGLTHQLIRWFRHNEPDTRLILEASGAANVYYLEALRPYLTIVPTVAEDMAMYNAVYFGCPDGKQSLVDFYKMVERDCPPMVLELTDAQKLRAAELLAVLGIKHPFVALQPRKLENEPERNVNADIIKRHLVCHQTHDVIITGLDSDCGLDYPSVKTLPDPHEASYLLSAVCDHFIGSNSGAWTVAHSYGRPVTIMNDTERAAWIYQ